MDKWNCNNLLKIFIIAGILINLVSSETKTITCYKCDENDVNCTTVDFTEKHYLKECTTECFTMLVEDKNKRGCTLELSEKENDLCNKNEKCEKCKESECNNKPLPENRSSCYKCKDAACKDLGKSSYCSDSSDGCFTYFDGKNSQRDCKKASGYELCEKNKMYCKECTGKECNKEEMELKCLHCESDKGKCKRPNKKTNHLTECTVEGIGSTKCTSTAEDDSKDLCYTYIDLKNFVRRGCLSDLKDDDYKTIDKNRLQKCKGNDCNTKCIEDISCIQCDSTTDKECGDSTDEPKKEWEKNCDEEYISICHRCELSDGKTIRGCGSNATMPKTCNFCYEEYCNAEQIERQCYECDENDQDCSHDDLFKLTVATCKDNIRTCFTALDKNGFTVRGCKPKDTDCPEGSSLCETCSDKTLCNSKRLPADRLSCFQCNAKTHTWCKEPNLQESNALTCHKYIKNDECYLYADKNENMYRGCLSDDLEKDENRKGCASDDKNSENKKCIKCNTTNCNISPYKRHSLKCIKCSDSDEKCSLGFDKNDAKDCQLTPYYSEETCFIHKDQGKINRGCTLDEDNKKFNCIDANNKNCQICKEDGCNLNKIEHQKCIRCRSDAEPICAEDGVGKKEADLCKNEKDADNLGCYTEKYKQNSNQVLIIRECVSELSADEVKQCQENKLCEICAGDACNNKKAPNSAIGIYSFSILFVTFIGLIAI